MSDTSTRWGFPLIEAGQAQKEMSHNEAVALIDLLIGASVVAEGLNAPPLSPVPGQTWVVGTAPGGAWAGHANAVAGWTDGGWRFIAPREGMAVWSEASGTVSRWRSGAWERGVVRAGALAVDGVTVVRAQRPAIAEATGGTTIDARARSVLNQVLDALRTHGLIAT